MGNNFLNNISTLSNAINKFNINSKEEIRKIIENTFDRFSYDEIRKLTKISRGIDDRHYEAAIVISSDNTYQYKSDAIEQFIQSIRHWYHLNEELIPIIYHGGSLIREIRFINSMGDKVKSDLIVINCENYNETNKSINVYLRLVLDIDLDDYKKYND